MRLSRIAPFMLLAALSLHAQQLFGLGQLYWYSEDPPFWFKNFPTFGTPSVTFEVKKLTAFPCQLKSVAIHVNGALDSKGPPLDSMCFWSRGMRACNRDNSSYHTKLTLLAPGKNAVMVFMEDTSGQVDSSLTSIYHNILPKLEVTAPPTEGFFSGDSVRIRLKCIDGDGWCRFEGTKADTLSAVLGFPRSVFPKVEFQAVAKDSFNYDARYSGSWSKPPRCPVVDGNGTLDTSFCPPPRDPKVYDTLVHLAAAENGSWRVYAQQGGNGVNQVFIRKLPGPGVQVTSFATASTPLAVSPGGEAIFQNQGRMYIADTAGIINELYPATYLFGEGSWHIRKEGVICSGSGDSCGLKNLVWKVAISTRIPLAIFDAPKTSRLKQFRRLSGHRPDGRRLPVRRAQPR